MGHNFKSKSFGHSAQMMTMAAVASIALIATPAMAQPPREEHGQGGGQARGGQGGGAAPAAPSRGNNGGGAAAAPSRGNNFTGGAPAQQAARPAQVQQQQAVQAPQAQRPQQNFAGNNNGGQFQRGGAQPNGQPGAPRGNFNGGNNGGPDFNRGDNRGVNVQRGGPGNGPGMSGQPRQNFANQRPWDEHRAGGPGGPGAGNYRAWSNDWRRDNRYDWRGWRDSHRETYHLGRYYAPYRDYSYRRLSAGFLLDPLFYGNSYTIYDPATYRLPDAYAPYRWVRYYDDAVLVDTYTGQVVDVMYGFFW